MKTILTFLFFIIAFQLTAQVASLSEKNKYVDKSGFNIQLNTNNGLSFNYENSLIRKGKYSLWGKAGIGSPLPRLIKGGPDEKLQVATPAGYLAHIEISNRWRFNPLHSLHLNAGVQRFQLFQPDKYDYLFSADEYDPLSKYIELDYRFEPKNSRWFFTTGYRLNFRNNRQNGGFKFGIGFKF